MTLGEYIAALTLLPGDYKDLRQDTVSIMIADDGVKIVAVHQNKPVIIYQNGNWDQLFPKEKAND